MICVKIHQTMVLWVENRGLYFFILFYLLEKGVSHQFIVKVEFI